MKRYLKALWASTMAVGLAGAGPAAAETTLTISSWGPPNHLITREVTMGWAAEVEKVTEGRVKLRLLAKHPSAPPGTFDAIRDGLVDVSFTGPNYTPARHIVTQIPEMPLAGVNSLVNSVAYNRIYWRHLHQAGEFKGVRLLTVFTHGPGQLINTKRAITAPADLRGLKVRTGGGVGEKLAQALGMSSFVKPAPESYELLSTGVADGVLFPLESIYGFKLESVVKHVTLFPGGLYNTTFAFMMSESKWNALSKTDQDLILSVSGEHQARRAGKAWDAADAAAEAQMRKAGIAVAAANEALIAVVREKAAVIEQDWIKAVAAKGIDGAKVLAEFRAELKKIEQEK